ncbi:hypothetical protein [Nesterenkonia sp. NBAIMH1]|uniref:hypothetical protein n=1 Tax=Nesterenkonia sp. NBAIMH1 TaxID=2600320 RepID=UPI0011B53709|nr:hypothetical protein [Nesterenkonia sp. NBAIMH1]
MGFAAGPVGYDADDGHAAQLQAVQHGGEVPFGGRPERGDHDDAVGLLAEQGGVGDLQAGGASMRTTSARPRRRSMMEGMLSPASRSPGWRRGAPDASRRRFSNSVGIRRCSICSGGVVVLERFGEARALRLRAEEARESRAAQVSADQEHAASAACDGDREVGDEE